MFVGGHPQSYRGMGTQLLDEGEDSWVQLVLFEAVRDLFIEEAFLILFFDLSEHLYHPVQGSHLVGEPEVS